MATMPAQKPGRSKQNYMTPACFIEPVKRRLGIADFDIDLAAEPDTAQAPIYFTKEDDAFAAPSWKIGDGWNWLNPEYADIGPWVERAGNESVNNDARTALLIPASVGSNWWRDYVHAKCEVLFLNGRIPFIADKPKWLYPKDCALLLYSRDALACIDNGDWPYDIWTWRY
jgi:phage N-6-adenine-methyltransferase